MMPSFSSAHNHLILVSWSLTCPLLFAEEEDEDEEEEEEEEEEEKEEAGAEGMARFFLLFFLLFEILSFLFFLLLFSLFSFTSETWSLSVISAPDAAALCESLQFPSGKKLL